MLSGNENVNNLDENRNLGKAIVDSNSVYYILKTSTTMSSLGEKYMLVKQIRNK